MTKIGISQKRWYETAGHRALRVPGTLSLPPSAPSPLSGTDLSMPHKAEVPSTGVITLAVMSASIYGKTQSMHELHLWRPCGDAAVLLGCSEMR